MRRITAMLIAGAALVAATACGDEAHGPSIGSCEDLRTDFYPCGGDVRGDWAIADLCVDPWELGLHTWEFWCPQASASTYVDYEGTVYIDDYTIRYSQTEFGFDGQVYFPAQCLYDAGFYGCYDVLIYEFTGADYAFCDQNGDDCDCRFSYSDTSPGVSYSYQAEGGVLLVDEELELAQYPYCVSGDEDRMAWDLSDRIPAFEGFFIFDRVR